MAIQNDDETPTTNEIVMSYTPIPSQPDNSPAIISNTHIDTSKDTTRNLESQPPTFESFVGKPVLALRGAPTLCIPHPAKSVFDAQGHISLVHQRPNQFFLVLLILTSNLRPCNSDNYLDTMFSTRLYPRVIHSFPIHSDNTGIFRACTQTMSQRHSVLYQSFPKGSYSSNIVLPWPKTPSS